VAAGVPLAVGAAQELTLQDWRVVSVTARPEPYVIRPGIEVAGYVLEFSAERRVQHYLLKVVLPLVLIVLMSWAVFWIDPSHAASQVSVATTSMLTLIAYRFAVGADVPPLPYLTLLDRFILASTLLVFLSLVEVLVTSSLAARGRIEAARTLDRHSRWLFPAVFAASAAVIYAR
jgi:cadmium resistance protein CadD (predicted permease)